MADTHILEPKAPRVHAAPEVRGQLARAEHRPSYKAFQALRLGFTVAPILAGADKFFHLLTNWDVYLAPSIQGILPMNGHTFMLIVGVIEIVAGLLVAVLPRIGGFVVAGWLMGIVLNLLMIPGYYDSYYDIALRDFGLALGALSLGFLAREYTRPLKQQRARVE
jgi:hypothetical protein